MIKLNQNIGKLRMFEQEFLYIMYTNDTTFFVKKQTFLIEILKIFENSSKISGLNLDKSKGEIAGIGALKGIRVVHCGIQCINLD